MNRQAHQFGALALAATVSLAGDGQAVAKDNVVSANGVELQTYSNGEGGDLTLVLVHGDSGSARQWMPVMDILANRYRLVSFDQRGHGASSEAPGNEYGYAARAADLASVIDAEVTGPFALIAHSGAAGSVLEYAATNPNELRGIYLLDPATDPRGMPEEMRNGFLGALASPEGLGALQGYYASIAGDNPATVAMVLEDAAKVTDGARIGVATALAFWNPEESIHAWKGPIFLANTPENDNPAALYHLRSSIAHGLLPLHGHWPQLDAPDIVADSIERFLKSLAEGSRAGQ
ncbi:MAG: alpha/beta hydrolase [Hyphomicrobiaceae bacterium]|nr:alpha/beta hydrolase [Hyphomicrobiaceae bacterium]